MTIREAQTDDIRRLLAYGQGAVDRMVKLTEQYASGEEIEDIFAPFADPPVPPRYRIPLDELEHGLAHELSMVEDAARKLRAALSPVPSTDTDSGTGVACE